MDSNAMEQRRGPEKTAAITSYKSYWLHKSFIHQKSQNIGLNHYREKQDDVQSFSDKAIPARYQSSTIPEPNGISSTVIKRCLSSSTYSGTLTVCNPLAREFFYQNKICKMSIANALNKLLHQFYEPHLWGEPTTGNREELDSTMESRRSTLPSQ